MKQTLIIALLALVALGAQAQPTIRYTSTESRAFERYGSRTRPERAGNRAGFATMPAIESAYRPQTTPAEPNYRRSSATGRRVSLAGDRVTFGRRSSAGAPIGAPIGSATLPGRPQAGYGDPIADPTDNPIPGPGGQFRIGGGGGGTYNPNPHDHDGGYGEPPQPDTPVGDGVPLLLLGAAALAGLKLRRSF